MKIKIGVFIAVAALSGCNQNPLVKSSEGVILSSSPAAGSQPVQIASMQSDTQHVQSSADATLPCMDTAPAKAAVQDKKVKTKVKRVDSSKNATPLAPCAAPTITSASVAAPATAVPSYPTAPISDAGKREVTGLNDWTGYIQGTPASHSKFSALKIGMGQKEVMDIVGPPTDQGTHVTGKAFIPFYMGSGKFETWFYYKGSGRLLFAANGGFTTNTGLIGIENDANERGYK